MNLNELDHTPIDSIDPSTQLGPIVETHGFAAWRIAPSTVLIRVDVDLDKLSAPELRELLNSYAAEWPRVILDLSNSLFVGAVCLELFAELNSRSRANDFQWAAIGSHPLRRLLRAARAEEEFPVTNLSREQCARSTKQRSHSKPPDATAAPASSARRSQRLRFVGLSDELRETENDNRQAPRCLATEASGPGVPDSGPLQVPRRSRCLSTALIAYYASSRSFLFFCCSRPFSASCCRATLSFSNRSWTPRCISFR